MCIDKHVTWPISCVCVCCRFAVMACCWALDPEERPKFQQLVQCLTEFHAALGAYVWKQAFPLFFLKNSDTRSRWTLFIRNTCMKLCLIRWKSRLKHHDFILYSSLEFLYSWIAFLQHSKVKWFVVKVVYGLFVGILFRMLWKHTEMAITVPSLCQEDRNDGNM